MNKKIAIFANAWSGKSLSDSLAVVGDCAREADVDTFVFISHTAPGISENEQREEKRIYQLADLSDFDGIIVFSSTMNFTEIIEDIRDRAVKAQIPAVSVGIPIEGMGYIGMSNKDSMLDLAEHLVSAHSVKTIHFIAGPKGHAHSDERIEAVREVLQQHGLPLSDDCIHYTAWGAGDAVHAIHELISSSNGHLPDAIVCANDIIAMVVCHELEIAGFHVPEDVLVTGYDQIDDGQIFYPSLCTIGQKYKEQAHAAWDCLMRMIEGEEVPPVMIKNQFVPNESCGCENKEANDMRIRDCKSRYFSKVHALTFGWSIKRISQMILTADTLSEVKSNLNEYFEKSNGVYSSSYFLQDISSKRYLEDGISEIPETYSDTFEVWSAVRNHEVLSIDTIKRRELIPGYEKKPGETNMHLFMPLYFEDRVFGYAVLDNWLESIENEDLKVFLDSFNSTLSKLEQNIALENLNLRLSKLYITDSLTGLYNRFGFESKGYELFNKCRRTNKPMSLMFIDINRMKLINDVHGHVLGDSAIITVADAIKASVPEAFLPIRFGGDEFLIMGACKEATQMETLKEQIEKRIASICQEMNYPFDLTASCGYIHFVPDSTRTLDSYINEVDNKMYDIKKNRNK